MAADNGITASFSNNFKISYEDIEFEKLHCPTPTSRQIPGKNANQTYMGATCQYMVNDDAEKPVYKEFRFEGPPMQAKYGIGEMTDATDGSKSYNIYTPLTQGNDKLVEFKGVLDGLHETMCDWAAEYGSYLGKPNLTKKSAIDVFPQLYKYPKDKITKQTQMNRDPFISNRVTIAGDNATIFIDLDKKIVPWRKLLGMEMEYVPLYTLGLYSGGMGVSFPMRMVECVVLWYRPRNVTSSQADTVDKYKAQYYEEFQKSLQAFTMKDSLNKNENESTLGSLQRNKEEKKEEVKGGSPPKVEPENSKARPPRRSLKEKQ